MNDLIAQTTGLDAKWIISGLAGAFALFAGWVGKFAKQMWSEFKDMHKDHTTVLESAINKQSESTNDLKSLTNEVLAETKEIKNLHKDTKFSIDEINKKLINL